MPDTHWFLHYSLVTQPEAFGRPGCATICLTELVSVFALLHYADDST